ncbi:unnamed protein product [Dicrocoelium dendriticum]|nr:unnamed protein product [Dicrocoelium dendriticum]
MAGAVKAGKSQTPSDKPSDGFLVYLAAANGDIDGLEKLLKNEECVNYVDELTGMMPIHAAAAWGNVGCLKVSQLSREQSCFFSVPRFMFHTECFVLI